MNNDFFLRPIAERTMDFLSEDMNIELVKNSFEILHPNKTELCCYTAVIGIGGSANLMFTMSFENDVLEALTKSFVYGEILEEEFEPLKESVVCEAANTVLGNAIVNFPNGGAGITITPPVMIEQGKSISKNGSSKISMAKIETKNGFITMAIIGKDTNGELLC